MRSPMSRSQSIFTRALSLALAVSLALVLLLARRVGALGADIRELRRQLGSLQPGALVPTVATTTLTGDTVTIGRQADSTARQVLFILTTTCPYCRATQQIWTEMADSFRRASPVIQVIGVTLDSLERTRAYADSLQLPYPIAPFPERKLVDLYRARLVPQTVVLDAEGRVLHARIGLLGPGPGLDSVYAAALGRQVRETTTVTASRGSPQRPPRK